MDITVVGAGLAGCEAAYQAAKRGCRVRLVDCKPSFKSAAHRNNGFAELVCSNSLKSEDRLTASGLLKTELGLLDCFLLKEAAAVRVAAGGALAVDRELFSANVTEKILNEPNITAECRLVQNIESGITVIATGPLTLGGLNDSLKALLGGSLGFYDASAPIVDAGSIDYDACFTADRYGRGSGDYVNCPLSKSEYTDFVAALISAESAQLHGFDKREIFEGCMPIEVMAKRGEDAIRFGPLRPVGFTDPRTGKRPYAVVQLRAENAARTMYNLVGFQTNLKFGEQKRVFSMIPALKNAEFLRYGVMHRNTYINSPQELDCYCRLKRLNNVFIAGQLSGVEGYVESIASGLVCGINAARLACGKPLVKLPETTVIGSLLNYLTLPNKDFQPMNANFGILPPLPQVRDKTERKRQYCARSESDLLQFKKQNDLI